MPNFGLRPTFSTPAGSPLSSPAAANAAFSASSGSEGGRRVLFYSGDDARAKAEVAALIDRLGFFGVDLGPLAVGGRLTQFPGGPLPALNLVEFD